MAGAPQGMSTVNMLDRMMANPINQKKALLNEQAQGINNMAVNQSDRMMGMDIATEEKRLLGLDRAGNELAMRKDNLDLAKRNLEFKQERLGIESEQFNQGLNLKRQEMDIESGNQGIEMGLGLLSLGAEGYAGYRANKQHKEWMSSMRDYARQQAGISYSYSHTDEAEFDDWYKGLDDDSFDWMSGNWSSK